jgi:hypothetical protein
MVAVQRDTLTIDRDSRVRLNNLGHTVWSPVGIFFWAVYKVVQTRNILAVDTVSLRTSDHPPTM